MLHFYSIANLFTSRGASSIIHTIKFRSLLRFSNLRWPQHLPFLWLKMKLKRKATDAGLPTSPLKKRNAVTAGIGRAAEPESNGIGFGYYGRTDDREDVRKPFFHPFSSHGLFRSLISHRTTPSAHTCFSSGSTANLHVETKLGCLHILWWPW